MPIAAADQAPSPWSRFITLRSGLGYKDNVLLSSAQEEESAFAQNSADLMFFRSGDEGPQMTFFGTAEDLRYFSGGSVDDEQTAISQFDINDMVGENWKIGTVFLYLYQNQVFDASSTTTNRVVQVRGHGFTVRPSITRYLPNDLRLDLRLTAQRQYLENPLDGYWEGGPRFLIGWEFAPKSDLTLSYAYRFRAYDSRRELSPLGFSQTAALRFEQQEVELEFVHHWDEARRWRTGSRLRYERNDDRGPGYFNYDRYGASQTLRFRSDKWEANMQAGAFHYDYDLQPVFVAGSPVRRRTSLAFTLGAQREIRDWFSLFAEYQREQTLSNDPFDEYRVNSVVAGAQFDF